MNEEQRERFKELCAVWIDHLNQIISFHPADGFEQLPFATHEAQMHFALEKCKDGYKIQLIWRHLYETHHSGFQFAAGSRDAAERTGACHRTGTGVYGHIETGLFL